MIGKKGVNAILNLAGLSIIADNYPPPDNLEREFNFADFTAIHIALEEMYGPSGGRGLALRAGRATFNDALNAEKQANISLLVTVLIQIIIC
jgi:hypothetical protein